jgi:hypothetical protein
LEQAKYIKLFHPRLKIGLANWREAWLFTGEYPEKLYAEVYKGMLVFRKRGSATRISYQQLKKGLIKKNILINEPPLPF